MLVRWCSKNLLPIYLELIHHDLFHWTDSGSYSKSMVNIDKKDEYLMYKEFPTFTPSTSLSGTYPLHEATTLNLLYICTHETLDPT